MFDTTDLRAAVDAGVISRDQAQRLEGFLEQRAGGASASDPETLRFLANFNDIFITVGLVLLISGVLLFSGLSSMGTAMRAPANAALFTLLPAAGLSWLLSEYFCARRRLLLPSMALAVMFSVTLGLAVAALAGSDEAADLRSLTGMWQSLGSVGLWGFGAIAAASVAYFVRFRLPFALFILALSIAALAYTGVSFFGDVGLVIGGLLSVLIGVATIGVAIGLDMSDPKRATRKADY
ncbi:MAG: hypothetical protein AAFQ18_04375, partial [Pseudomonadota bacterium]